MECGGVWESVKEVRGCGVRASRSLWLEIVGRSNPNGWLYTIRVWTRLEELDVFAVSLVHSFTHAQSPDANILFFIYILLAT